MRLRSKWWPTAECISPTKYQSSCTASTNPTLLLRGTSKLRDKALTRIANWKLLYSECKQESISSFTNDPSPHTYPAAQPSETCPMSQPSTTVVEHTLRRCRSQAGTSHYREVPYHRSSAPPALSALTPYTSYRPIKKYLQHICICVWIVWHRYELLAIYSKVLWFIFGVKLCSIPIWLRNIL